jgi:hypothetical protein
MRARRPHLAAMRRAAFAVLALALLLTTMSASAGAADPAVAHVAGQRTLTGRHAPTCRVLRRRLAHHRPLRAHVRARAVRCRHAARLRRIARVKHRRALARRHTLVRRHRLARQVPTPRPTQATSATTRGDAQGWNGFGAGSWPSADWRPYAADSPFNRSLGGGAQVAARSAQIVHQVLSWGEPGNLMAGSADSSNDYGHPTYYAQPSDPLYTLRSSGYSPAIDGAQIRIPAAARAAGGADGHMTIVEPDGWEYDLWQADAKRGGTLSFALGGRTRIDGSGLESNATAARFGNLAGVIRAQELAAGHIDHALFIVVKCASTSTSFGYGTRPDSGKSAYVFPAAAGGSECSGADNADAPPLGARFQLAMSAGQIDAMGVPTWKKAILHALATYGGYVGDTGGPGFGLQFESSTMYTAFGFADPLVSFAKQNDVGSWNGMYAFNVAGGVDWARYLRVVAPPSR